MAPWLQDLEFRNVKTPSASIQAPTVSPWGGTSDDVEIWFYGKPVTDVRLEIQALGNDYMIATAASNRSVVLSPYTRLDLEEDTLSWDRAFSMDV